MTQNILSAVIPVVREVPTASGPVAVRPFRLFGQMAALNTWLPKLGPFFEQLKAGQYLAALNQASEACLQLVLLSTRMQAEQIEALEADEQLAVLVATVEVNLDFFVHRLTPQIAGMLVSLTPLPAQPGPGDRPEFQDMTVRAAERQKTPETVPTSGLPPQTH